MATQSYLQDWCIDYIAQALEMPRSKVDAGTEFDALGLDSATAVTMVMELERMLGVELDPEMLFQYPTVQSLTTQLEAMSEAAAPAPAQAVGAGT